MNFGRPYDDLNSIWASRPSSIDTEDGSNNSTLHRRARAGTLPSRFPSRLETTSLPRPDLSADGEHHGSLALISPDGNDIVYDRPLSSSRLAVGQHISSPSTTLDMQTPRRSPPLAPILEPNANPAVSSKAQQQQQQLPLNSHLTAPLNSRGGRTRSGSMNSLGMGGSYRPFGQSIWDQPQPVQPQPSQQQQQQQQQGVLPSTVASAVPASVPASVSPAQAAENDPLFLFTNELNKSAMPNRIRSYTLDTTNEWAAPQPPQPAINLARGRAQTLFGGGNSTLPAVSLNRFGKQHQLQHEATALGGVQLGGELSHVPTPALWISNVPPQATPYTLHSLFGTFGRIESARVVPSRRCAYVLFASTVQAIEAQATANGMEMYAGNGPSTVAFAQVAPAASSVAGGLFMQGATGAAGPSGSVAAIAHPPAAHSPVMHTPAAGHSPAASQSGVAPAISPISIQGGAASASASASASAAAPLVASTPLSSGSAEILQILGAGNQEIHAGVALLTRAASTDFNTPIPSLSELLDKDCERAFNTAALRELRRKLENQQQSIDIVDTALDMQKELPILGSDYIGNTVVQHVFEAAPAAVRDMMLRRLKPVFAATGTHKNGTWAVQKMIDLARGPRQFYLCAQAIQPHLVPLLLDQFGNYVVQGCLKFGAPYSDFVYAGIAASLAKIAPNRFGARAIRAVLESKFTNVASQRLVATAIAQQLPTLATNPNGCLLVSWLLDHAHCPTAGTTGGSSASPDASDEEKEVDPGALAQQLKTHALVASQLIPSYLVALCTSKLGSSIILKLACSPAHASSQRVFDALFEPLSDIVPTPLTEIINDQTNQGASCISRLLSVFPASSIEKQVATNKVRAALMASSVVHKRLMEDVGLEETPASASAAAAVSQAGIQPSTPESVEAGGASA